MKAKRNLLVAIASVLAVAGMASCGAPASESTTPADTDKASNTGTATATSTESSVDYAMPVISRDAPKEVALGSVIDLDQYVTVNASGGYTLKVITGEADIDNHLVTTKTLGLLEITVTSGTYRKLFQCNVVSQAKLDLCAVVETLNKNYTCTVYENGEYIGYAKHTDKAWMTDYSAAFEDEEPSGMAILSDGKWYEYKYDTDTDTATFPPQSYNANGDYYFLSMAFPLDGDSFVEFANEDGVYVDDEDGSTIVVTKEGLKLHYESSGDTYVTTIISGLGFKSSEFDAMTVEFGEDHDTLIFTGYSRLKVDGKTVLGVPEGADAYQFVITDINATSIPDVERIALTDYIPPAVNADDLVTFFDGLNAAKNVTVTSWSAWYNKKGEKIDAPSLDGDYTVEDYGFWDYSAETRITENGIFFHQQAENSIYEVGQNPDDLEAGWFIHSQDLSEAEDAENTTTALEAGEDFTTWGWAGTDFIDDAAIANLNIQGKLENPENYYVGYDMDMQYAGLKYAYDIDFSDDDDGNIRTVTTSSGSSVINAFLGTMCAPVDPRYNMLLLWGSNYKYFDFSNLLVYENGDFGFELSVRWSTDGDGEYFCLFVTFSDIGTTVLPDDFMANADFSVGGEEEVVDA